MYDYTNNMQMMGMPSQYSPMMDMSQSQLESMYPNIYNVVYPHVKHHCDMFEAKYGMANPTKQQLDDMMDDIYNKVDGQIDMMPQREDERPDGFGHGGLGFGRRPFLRDLIGILLIRQLLARRRPCYEYGCPGYGGYDEYPTPYGGYPMGYGMGYGPY